MYHFPDKEYCLKVFWWIEWLSISQLALESFCPQAEPHCVDTDWTDYHSLQMFSFLSLVKGTTVETPIAVNYVIVDLFTTIVLHANFWAVSKHRNVSLLTMQLMLCAVLGRPFQHVPGRMKPLLECYFNCIGRILKMMEKTGWGNIKVRQYNVYVGVVKRAKNNANISTDELF